MNTQHGDNYGSRATSAEHEDSTRSVSEYRGNSYVLMDGDIPQNWLWNTFWGFVGIVGACFILTAISVWLR